MKCSDCGRSFVQVPWQVRQGNRFCPACRAETARAERAMAVADGQFVGIKAGSVDGLDYLLAYRAALALKSHA